MLASDRLACAANWICWFLLMVSLSLAVPPVNLDVERCHGLGASLQKGVDV